MFHISTSHITQNAFALKGREVQSDLHKKLGAYPPKIIKTIWLVCAKLAIFWISFKQTSNLYY